MLSALEVGQSMSVWHDIWELAMVTYWSLYRKLGLIYLDVHPYLGTGDISHA